jgi:hypothetical protein
MSSLTPTVRTPYITIEDRTLYFTEVESSWWIALKPIVEALGLSWPDYLKALKADPILGQLWGEFPMVAADGKLRKMICLPERYIYGWVFQLRSANPKLLAFKRLCYDALFEYFHGPEMQRRNALTERAHAVAEQRRLRKELESHPTYQRLVELNGVILSRSKMLKEQDRVVENEQLQLFAEMGLAHGTEA